MLGGGLMQSRGFTLTELVVVIVLIGILGVVIFPRFANKSDFDQAGYRAQVVSAIQFGRKIAVASRRYVCVTVSANKLSLALDPTRPEDVKANPPLNCVIDVNLPGSSASVTRAPSGVALANGGNVSFNFDPSGWVVSGTLQSTSASIPVTGAQAITVESSGYVH